MKTAYRNGLRNRYGGMMQAISGVHFNYSFPAKLWDAWAAAREWRGPVDAAAMSTGYFDLLRNYRRHGWLVLYLFGASPAVGRSFLDDSHSDLPLLDAATAYEPYATSLRMSDIGYRNRNQAGRLGVGQQPRALRARPARTRWRRATRRTRSSACAWMASIGSSTRTSCRSRTSTTASSGRSASCGRVRAPVARCCVPASNTWKCARSTSVAFDPVGVNQNKLRFMEAFLALCLLRLEPAHRAVGAGVARREPPARRAAWARARPHS